MMPVKRAGVTMVTMVQEVLRLNLPQELVTHFEALAVINGCTTEEAIAAHLARTKSFSDAAPMYFNDGQTVELKKLLGTAVASPDKVIDMLRRLVSQRIGKYKVVLSPAREEAIYWWVRNSGMKEDAALAMLWDQALGLLLKC